MTALTPTKKSTESTLRAELEAAQAELRSAREAQAAITHILELLNSSKPDAQPVLQAIVDHALRLCDGRFADVFLSDGKLVHLVAHNFVAAAADATDPGADFEKHYPQPLEQMSLPAKVILSGRLIQFPDVLADPNVTDLTRRNAQAHGYRAGIMMPMMHDSVAVGVIGVARAEPGEFPLHQVRLLQTFANQAAIAIENTRLFNGLNESLEQQTATAEVLGVINASTGNLTPVFETMVEKAMRLCGASFGAVSLFQGDEHHCAVAARGGPPGLAKFITRPVQSPPGSIASLIRGGEAVIHIPDIAAVGPEFRSTGLVAMIQLGSARTALWVGLNRDGVTRGFFTFYREEVRPFTERQIALVQNFAAQAVIAMENERLLDEIRQRQAELRVTFDNMADGVAMFDQELRLAAWNKNFQELLDLPDDFLAEPRNFDDYIRFLTTRGEFGEADPDAEIARLRARSTNHYSLERTRPDGRIIELRHNPMPEGGFVLIYSDITERKRSEAEIRIARDQAEAALKELKAAQATLIQAEKMASLGQLTAGIAHEIKNPLNFVNNFASLSNELLAELKEIAQPAIDSLDADRRADVDETIKTLSGNLSKIVQHGGRADNIVKSMLEHSRGVSGERRPVDLNALVEEALSLAYHGARAQDQNFNITLERDFDRALKPIEVAPQDIMRVFLNLFSNGFYAANKRAEGSGAAGFHPVLHITTKDAGDAVEVRVRDNGIGIPPDIRDKLFQPFFTTKPTGEGTGLGLSISYDIVTQMHGGTIAVDSEAGQFTEFTIRLPRGGEAATKTPGPRAGA
jgi:two-component system, NtrC family, sensor kinase